MRRAGHDDEIFIFLDKKCGSLTSNSSFTFSSQGLTRGDSIVKLSSKTVSSVISYTTDCNGGDMVTGLVETVVVTCMLSVGSISALSTVLKFILDPLR